jgi:DNA-binding response OmpR family regulator
MPKVLIVEDDSGAQRLVEFTLQQEGFEVITAANGQQGLEKAQFEQPDVIVMDIMMPVMSGLEACLRLKEVPTTSHIPILVLTAKGHDADRTFSLMAGADDYVVKPADLHDVAERVRKLAAQGVAQASE